MGWGGVCQVEIEILVSRLAFAGTHVLLTTAGGAVGAPLASTEISRLGQSEGLGFLSPPGHLPRAEECPCHHWANVTGLTLCPASSEKTPVGRRRDALPLPAWDGILDSPRVSTDTTREGPRLQLAGEKGLAPHSVL